MLFGLTSFTTVPYLDSGQHTRAFLKAEISIEGTVEFSIFVSTAPDYVTASNDEPANQPFRGVLQDYTFTRSIVSSEIGPFVPGNGTLSFCNNDAFYDFLPREYTIDATDITVKVLDRDKVPYVNAYEVGNVVGTGWHIDLNEVKVDLRDAGYKLDVPMQPNVYAGTGDQEGSADLANKLKPLAFGTPHDISPPLVVPSHLIYQVSDGPVQAITAVYDRGLALTFDANYSNYTQLKAATIPAGSYATCLAEGYFRLGALGEVITCDVAGDNRIGYISTSADAVRWAILFRTSLTYPDEIDLASFDAVNAAQAAPIEYWLGPDDAMTVSDFIANIMGAILGWGGHRRDGLYEIRLFTAPATEPVMGFTKNDIIGDDLKREPLPSAYRPPPWRWRVPYARAFTTQTNLTTAVSADRKAFLAEEYRLGGAEDENIKIDHPFAVDPDPIQAYFASKVDADSEGQRRINLFRTTRALYRFSVDRRGFLLDIGDVIQLSHERFDLTLGRLMVVLQLTERISFSGEVETVEILAYG